MTAVRSTLPLPLLGKEASVRGVVPHMWQTAHRRSFAILNWSFAILLRLALKR